MTPMHGYIYRLLPPRSTFSDDMTPEEADMMGDHVAYWSELAAAGRVLAFGPVADPEEPYGFAVILAPSRAAVELMRDRDPAILSSRGFNAEIATIRHLITPTGAFPG